MNPEQDYYQFCLESARNELDGQVQSLIHYCAELTESNEAEATFVAAAKIESLINSLE